MKIICLIITAMFLQNGIIKTDNEEEQRNNLKSLQKIDLSQKNISFNNAPSFDIKNNVEIYNSSINFVINNFVTNISVGCAIDEWFQNLRFKLYNDNTTLFSQQPVINSDGNLIFKPALGVTGVANITVTLIDDGGIENGGTNTSDTKSFTITVTDYNNYAVTELGYIFSSNI